MSYAHFHKYHTHYSYIHTLASYSPINRQVWQGSVSNCQAPQLLHLLTLLSLGASFCSAMFLHPTAPQSMHWYNLNPSGISVWSSHKNSVLRLHPLHLNLVTSDQFVASKACAIFENPVIATHFACDNRLN